MPCVTVEISIKVGYTYIDEVYRNGGYDVGCGN